MPLDGHSYLVSQGWSGHGTGLRQDSIIRPLAIPQKRTLAGLGKDRDEAFPFWDHVFSVAAKSIQVKLYKDDDDSSGAEDTPKQASLDLTTTGILSNKPPKLGSSAIATPASSSSNSGLNTPIRTTIPNSLVSSSSNLLVAAKKESAKRMLYSRFFRGPTLGPDSDSSDSCHDGTSHYGAAVEGRTRDDDSGWNSNFNEGAKSGGRTPMAIAKSKLTSASEAVIPLKKALENVKGEEQKKAKKRKRGDDDEAEVRQQEKEDRKKKGKEEKKKERQDKKEQKKRKRDGKESLKEEEKREKKSKKDKTTKTLAGDKPSFLESTHSNKDLTQIIEPNEASMTLDKAKSIPCSGDEELHNDKSEKKSKKKRKRKDDRIDTSGDKEKRRRERKQKRDRKEAEKKKRKRDE